MDTVLILSLVLSLCAPQLPDCHNDPHLEVNQTSYQDVKDWYQSGDTYDVDPIDTISKSWATQQKDDGEDDADLSE
jgi:hypothetical protein